MYAGIFTYIYIYIDTDIDIPLYCIYVRCTYASVYIGSNPSKPRHRAQRGHERGALRPALRLVIVISASPKSEPFLYLGALGGTIYGVYKVLELGVPSRGPSSSPPYANVPNKSLGWARRWHTNSQIL